MTQKKSYGYGAAVMALSALLLVTLLTRSTLLAYLNQGFHDAVMRAQTRPPHPDIVVVAIDDKSLGALGPLPWSPEVHAQVLNRLTDVGVKTVGLDVRLAQSGPVPSDADQALAQAMRRNQGVVMAEGEPGGKLSVPPPPLLREAALATSHVRMSVDRDGQVRRVLPYAGGGEDGGERRMYLAQALYRDSAAAQTPEALPPPWVIAYAGPPGHFPRASYVDVLQGRAPTGSWQGKKVLVGVTATGVGSQFATPLSYGYGLMPRVEVHANALDSLLQGRVLSAASPLAAWLFNLVPVALMVLAMVLQRLGPLSWFGVALGLSALTSLAAVAAQRWGSVQVSPLPAVFTLAVMGGGYWWYQWRLSLRYLSQELLRFRGSRAHEASTATLGRQSFGDALRRGILSLREVVQQLRDLQRFVRDSLDALPDATLVCDADGKVQLANTAAAQLFGDHTASTLINHDRRFRPGDPLRGHDACALLDALQLTSGSEADCWRSLFCVPAQTLSVTASHPKGRYYLIKLVPTKNSAGGHAGWVMNIVDISAIHEANRQRDQALGFMSHDMRAPQSAILSLLEMRRRQPEQLPSEQFEERVERHARKALSMADGFIQLARAQSRPYHLQTLDLVNLVRETLDDTWEVAQQSQVTLRYVGVIDMADAQVDRELLGRAVGNLLGNAIKFSPPQSAVEVDVYSEAGHWVVSVSDAGPGIAPEARAELFKPFFRDASARRVEGVGLGLSLVQTVMARHGGRVEVHSQLGRGSRFELWLPRTQAQGQEQDHA